jgi:hypothetical protein
MPDLMSVNSLAPSPLPTNAPKRLHHGRLLERHVVKKLEAKTRGVVDIAGQCAMHRWRREEAHLGTKVIGPVEALAAAGGEAGDARLEGDAVADLSLSL